MSGKALLILALVVGVVIVALLSVPVLLSTEAVRDMLLRQVEERTGLRISTQRLDLRLLPRPGLDARQVRVFDRASGTPVVTADRMEVALQIAPLFAGLVVGDYVIVERPHLTLRRDAAGDWTMGIERPEASQTEETDEFDVLTMVRRVLVTDGVLTIENERPDGRMTPLQLSSIQATVAEDMPGRTARVQVSAELPHDAGRTLLNLEGALLLVERAGVDGETAASHQGVQIEGTVRVHGLNVSQLAGWMDMPELAKGFGSGQLAGRFRLIPRAVGYDLMVTDWSAGLSDLTVQGMGSLTALGTEAAFLSATVSAPSIPLKQTVEQLPEGWLPETVRKRFDDLAVDGVASLYDTHIEGPLANPSELNVTGGLDLRDGRIVPEADQPAVRDLSATIAFDLKQIRVTGLRASYGPVRLSDGSVLVTDWRGDPMADARISAEARAVDLIALATGMRRFPQIETVLRQFDQVTGEVRLKAHASGRPVKQEVDVAEASLTIRNVGFRHTAVAVPFRDIDAKVDLVSTGEVRLERLEGRAGPARVEAAGRVTLTGEPTFEEFTLKATTNGDAFAPWLRQLAANEYTPQVDGLILFTGLVSGQVKTPRFSGTLTLDGASVNVPNVFTKAKGAPAGIRLEAEVSEDRMLSVRRAELIVPPVRLTGEGRMQLSEAGEFHAKIVSDALSVEKLPRGVTLGPLRAGILRAGLTMDGRLGDRASWTTSGKLRFVKGMVHAEQLADPVRDLTVGLRFDGKNVEIRRVSFRLGESDLRLSGVISNWLDAPQVKLLVESSQIDVESLLPRQTDADASDEGVPLLRGMGRDTQVEAIFLIDHIFYQKMLLSGFSCRLRFSQGVLTVDRISSDTGEGDIRGRLVLTLSDRGLESIRTRFRASGIPVERLSIFTKQPPQVTGWLRAGGKIQADFGQRGLRRSSINSRRPITILVEDGRIYNVPVLAKLLSIMNLPALLEGKVDITKDGMPLDRLKAVFTMEDGILQFKELLVDSPILKISATGLYDYIGDKFDAVIVASPLGQYSELLKSVPLFGRLFAGERQGFDTAIFELKGSAKDPTISYLPAESLMAGVKGTAQLAVDLLVNAITLPAEVYSEAEDLLGDDDEP